MLKQNKHDGFMCVSCAWGKARQAAPVRSLRERRQGDRVGGHQAPRRPEPSSSNHTLGRTRGLARPRSGRGRPPDPSRCAGTRRPTNMCRSPGRAPSPRSARELRALRRRPRQTVFYASGRASLEASYMWQLLARMYGTNNLPDSSNMCHESTSVALPREHRRLGRHRHACRTSSRPTCILYVAHNPGTSSPRILHQLQDAAKRGAQDHRRQPAARARPRAVQEPAEPGRDADAQGDADRRRDPTRCATAATSPC